MKSQQFRIIVAAILVALVISACQKDLPPVIDSLTATPDSIFPGDTSILAFTVIGGGGVGDVLEVEWHSGQGLFVHDSDLTDRIVKWVAPKYIGDHYIFLSITNSAAGNMSQDSVFVHVNDTMGAFIDPRDGNEYDWVKIGSQIWMAENLAYLTEITSADSMSSSEKCYYVCGFEGNNVAEAKATMAYICYGVWYNWPAAMDGVNGSGDASLRVQGVCPPGWHLPSDDEWAILEGSLGMSESEFYKDGWRYSGTVGGKLKEAGTNHWAEPNYLATNSSGFNALPAGGRDQGKGFCSLSKGEVALFWTATAYDINLSWYRSLFYLDGGVGRHRYYNYGGRSIRCVKN